MSKLVSSPGSAGLMSSLPPGAAGLMSSLSPGAAGLMSSLSPGAAAGALSKIPEKGVGSMIGYVAGTTLSSCKSLSVGFFTNMNHVYTFITSLVGIFVIILIAMVVVYFMRYRHFRVPQLCRSVEYDPFLEEYAKDLVSSFQGIHDINSSGGDSIALEFASLFPSTQAQLTALLIQVETILGGGGGDALFSSVLSYMRFGNALDHMDFLSHHDLRENATEFKSGGDIDEDLVNEFRSKVVEPLKQIKALCNGISLVFSELSGAELGTNGQLKPALSSRLFLMLLHIHHIRLLGSYTSDLQELAQPRRSNLKTGVLTIYYAGLIREWWSKRIPRAWSGIPKRFKATNTLLNTNWTTIGKQLGMITCYLAFSDPDERAEKCAIAEKFFVRKVNDDDGDEEEVTETFGLVDLISSIVLFMKNITYVGTAIAKFAVSFPVDPFGTIIGILTLFLGTIFGLILNLIYAILTGTQVIYIAFIMLSIQWSLLFAWAVTIFYFILSIVLLAPYIILFLLDLVTDGTVLRLMRCENLPDTWMTEKNFAYGNMFQRSIIYLGLVQRPCKQRFRPANLCMCVRNDDLIPDYCPQQQIYRTFKNVASGQGPQVYEKFHPPSGFMRHSPKLRVQLIMQAHRDKMKWNGVCNTSLSPYDFINRHICTNPRAVAALGQNNSPATTEFLESVCRDAYCNSRETKGSTFCKRIDSIETQVNSVVAGELYTKTSELLKKTIMFTMLLVMVVSLISVFAKVSEFIHY